MSNPRTTDEQQAVDSAAVAAAKRGLREAVLLRRGVRTREEREADDGGRLDLVQRTLADRMPDTVAAYLSTGTEPATLRLVAWLAAHDVRVLLPVLTHDDGSRRDGPAWAPYAGPDALRPGWRSVLEPTTATVPAAQLPEAEILICPALAANRFGDRLGRGGGWYDRALAYASQSAPVWVLLNREEVLPVIPVHAWDRRVDVIVTPDAVLTCEPPHAG